MSKKDAPAPFASIDAFREAAKAADAAGTPLVDPRVRSSFDTEIKASDEEGSRTLMFTISTASVDRMGDTIKQDGWKLDNYRKNPVVLFGHDASSLPVAKSIKIWLEDNKLKSEAEWTPKELVRFNDIVFEMCKGGFLSATSVGFAPSRYSFSVDPARNYGIDFLEQELLEYSVVPIPANAEALIEGKSAGLDILPMLEFCEQALIKAGGADRIIALAEQVLGKDGKDTVAVSWASGVIERSGRAVISKERLEAIERAATKARIEEAAKKRARKLNLLRITGE